MLRCERCYEEIVPGDYVEFIGAEPTDRILMEGDALVVHKSCPVKASA